MLLVLIKLGCSAGGPFMVVHMATFLWDCLYFERDRSDWGGRGFHLDGGEGGGGGGGREGGGGGG